MQTNEMELTMMTIREKLGDKKADIINDELTKISSDNKTMNEDIESKNTEIEKLRDKNDTLQETNNKLFQQVGFTPKPPTTIEPKPDETPKSFSFKSVFDDKGNFID